MSVPLFEKFVTKHDLDIELVESEEGTRTAEEAAEVHGVPVSNIVKSLVVKADGEFAVVLCPGDERLDFKALRETLGKKSIQMADADDVKDVTGHSIGGVPPFGHEQPLFTIIVDGFDSAQPLWAAAGAATVNFKISPSQLEEIVKKVNSMVG